MLAVVLLLLLWLQRHPEDKEYLSTQYVSAAVLIVGNYLNNSLSLITKEVQYTDDDDEEKVIQTKIINCEDEPDTICDS